ncbi:MAG: hypothetical protein IPK77_09695 [Cellvibrio sp.]|nr:hypothetical protein [Cellvibrio sp.]
MFISILAIVTIYALYRIIKRYGPRRFALACFAVWLAITFGSLALHDAGVSGARAVLLFNLCAFLPMAFVFFVIAIIHKSYGVFTEASGPCHDFDDDDDDHKYDDMFSRKNNIYRKYGNGFQDHAGNNIQDRDYIW